ncbi:MAG TPA: GNAT family N-acetyltransferase [Pyrinomonadaceae bacterium]
MNISLREVGPGNFDQVVALEVKPEQSRFVTPNVRSIADSKIYPYLVPLAIYDGEEVVGFALYGRDTESKKYWIVRLMIGSEFQGNGLGHSATVSLIELISRLPECGEIFLSFVPDNEGAERLYRNVGFLPTGETDDTGEIIMRYAVMSKQASNIG